MSDYRRAITKGATCFFIVLTYRPPEIPYPAGKPACFANPFNPAPMVVGNAHPTGF